MRIVTFSTVPVHPFIDMTSPTLNCSSKIMNTPAIMSDTIPWAPRPIATAIEPETAARDVVDIPAVVRIVKTTTR
ncbi:hypothetical protein IMSAG049_01195 [Clostridiales bacterium]|nr:hypothetical protein IMSAG049_01195 [Clostridiales bacterium]